MEGGGKCVVHWKVLQKDQQERNPEGFEAFLACCTLKALVAVGFPAWAHFPDMECWKSCSALPALSKVGSRCFGRIALTSEKFWLWLSRMKDTKKWKGFRKWWGLLMFLISCMWWLMLLIFGFPLLSLFLTEWQTSEGKEYFWKSLFYVILATVWKLPSENFKSSFYKLLFPTLYFLTITECWSKEFLGMQ